MGDQCEFNLFIALRIKKTYLLNRKKYEVCKNKKKKKKRGLCPCLYAKSSDKQIVVKMNKINITPP